jgi:indole-3-glycerol phosphate synthase
MPDEPQKTVLDEIVAARRLALQATQAAVPLAHVRQMAEEREERRDFAGAVGSGGGAGVRVIAELKRASPSRGMIRPQYCRREIAAGYAAAGAAALSVLTEEQYFLGSLGDLQEARQAVEIPVLRKDFILESYQVYEAVAAGADALLLIVAVLPDADLRRLLDLCGRLRIAALVEVHTQAELDRAVAAGAQVIGVNNRNLKTMQVSLETSLELRAKMPRGCVAVSESGIKTGADLRRLSEAGFQAVLIGESLMTQPDPGEALRHLLAEFAGAPASSETRNSMTRSRS